MRYNSSRILAYCAAVLVIVVAGCSLRAIAPNPSSPAQDATTISSLSRESGTFGTWMYTCDGISSCPIYKTSGTRLTYRKTIVALGEPWGSVVTSSGDWYLAEANQFIAVFSSTRNGPVGPKLRLKDPGETPYDVAVDTTHKLVAVSSANTTASKSGSLSIYANGSTSPTSKLTYSVPGGLASGKGVAIDHAGNCYWGVDDVYKQTAYVVEFVHCRGTAKVIAQGLNFAGGMAFDKGSNLFYVDQVSGIYKCKGSSKCKLFKNGFVILYMLRFDSGWKNLWVTDGYAHTIIAINPTTGAIESTTQAHGGGSSAAIGLAPAPGPAY